MHRVEEALAYINKLVTDAIVDGRDVSIGRDTCVVSDGSVSHDGKEWGKWRTDGSVSILITIHPPTPIVVTVDKFAVCEGVKGMPYTQPTPNPKP